VRHTGHHGLSCNANPDGRLARHSQANDLIRRALASSGTPARLEPQGLSPDGGLRPDGLTMIPWKRGRCAVWDFTCWDTFAPTHIASSSVAAGKVAESAESLKSRKYAQLAGEYQVVPVCIETLGSWGPSATSFIEEIGRRLRVTKGENRATAFLVQSLSIAVQRGNATSVMATLGTCRGLEELLEL